MESWENEPKNEAAAGREGRVEAPRFPNVTDVSTVAL